VEVRSPLPENAGLRLQHERLTKVNDIANEEIVLLVDDNRPYREAVKRNLEFVGYDVDEAEDMDEALTKLRSRQPLMIITDLDMRTHTEGLDLIKTVKARYPRIPVVLISAVGTFDEGAVAMQMGALHVISKSRIDEEIDNLYECLDRIKTMLASVRDLREKVEDWLMGDQVVPRDDLLKELEQKIADPDVDVGLKSDLFDLMNQIRSGEREQEVRSELERVHASREAEEYGDVTSELRSAVDSFDNLHEETRSMLETADLFKRMEDEESTLSVSRNVSFSYCFAVENEIKYRLGKKIARFTGGNLCPQLLSKLYDRKLRNLNLYFTQSLLLQKVSKQDGVSVDIIRQVLERMCKHGNRYKPDGLKALGVVLYCFGRNLSFQDGKKAIRMENALGLKGLDDDETAELADALIRLQHLRNPYIHPEFSEREKTSALRDVTLQTLNLISRVS